MTTDGSWLPQAAVSCPGRAPAGRERAVFARRPGACPPAQARRWFAEQPGPGATCPITQGILLRLAMRLGGCSIEQALSLLTTVTAHPRHRFWPDVLPYDGIRWHGVIGHRQVTDAYLAALARSQRGKLASFDAGLVALHQDVGVALPA